MEGFFFFSKRDRGKKLSGNAFLWGTHFPPFFLWQLMRTIGHVTGIIGSDV